MNDLSREALAQILDEVAKMPPRCSASERGDTWEAWRDGRNDAVAAIRQRLDHHERGAAK